MSHVATYYAGKLSAGSFRSMLDNAKMRGLLSYTETKGILQNAFHVRASSEVHQNIRDIIRKETGR